jgi:hypothetical protein
MAFRLYVDEVGNDDLTHAHDERHRYLSLSGVILDQDYVRDTVSPELDALKARIFGHHPDEPVWLHRKDIMNRKGPFEVLNDELVRVEFDASLINFLERTDYALITVVIDKAAMMQQRHWEQRHPYHYLMSILIEKYAKWLERCNSKGDVMPEKRHGKKDAALQEAYNSVRSRGTRYAEANLICGRIPSEPLKFRSKPDNIAGLQICDLIAHASHTYVRRINGQTVSLGPFSERVVPILTRAKFDRSPWWGTIKGYGAKYLP